MENLPAPAAATAAAGDNGREPPPNPRPPDTQEEQVESQDAFDGIPLAQPDVEPCAQEDEGAKDDTSPHTLSEHGSEYNAENASITDMEVDPPEPEAVFAELVATGTRTRGARPKFWKEQVQFLFAEVYNKLRFDPSKITQAMNNYPTLEKKELEVLYEAILVMGTLPDNQYQKWRNLVTDGCRSLTKSTWPLAKILSGRLGRAQIESMPVTSPWGNPDSQKEASSSETAAAASDQGEFQFSKSAYTATEIAEMRAACEQPFGLPETHRPATDLEVKIVLGMVHGHIVSCKLPQFIKRILNTDQRSRLRNTIRAQVEGELIMNLTDDLPMYAFNQTTHRLMDIVAVASAKQMGSNPVLAEMIKAVKTASYNVDDHAVHLYFKTRQQAARYEGMLVPFRHRKLKLINAHPEVETDSQPQDIWQRQRTPDGIANKSTRRQYRMLLINISRFVDTQAIAQYIRAKTDVPFELDEMDSGGPTAADSVTWEIVFHIPGCPELFKDKTRMSWFGTVIIIHHTGQSKRQPCLACGSTAHAGCEPSNAQLDKVTIVVGETDRALLSHKPTTYSTESDLTKALMGQEKEADVPKAPLVITSEVERQSTGNQGANAQSSSSSKTTAVTNQTTIGQHVHEGKPRSQKLSKTESSNETGSRAATAQQTGTPAAGERLAKQPSQWQVKLSKKAKKKGAVKAPKALEGRTARAQRALTYSGSSDEAVEAKQAQPATILQPARDKPTFTPIIDDQNISRWVKLMSKTRESLLTEDKRDTNASNKWIQADTTIDLEDYPSDLKLVCKAAGLVETEVPRTGNCQYYAVCLGLLQQPLSKTNSATLKRSSEELKTGIKAAAYRNFELHFPKGTWAAPLDMLGRGIPNLTDRELVQAYRHYFADIAQSSSELHHTLEKDVWGNSDTLRMASYLLNEPIFVVGQEAKSKLSFTIFKPVTIERYKLPYQTANHFVVNGKQWVAGVRATAHEAKQGKCKAPIVLCFSNAHYNALLCHQSLETTDYLADSSLAAYRRRADKTATDWNTDVDMTDNNAEDYVKPGFDASDEAEAMREEDYNSDDNLWDPAEFQGDEEELFKQVTQPKVAHNDQLQLFEILKHGGSRLQELVSFMPEGYEQLSRNAQQELGKLDLKDSEAVRQWQQRHSISLPVLKGWKVKVEEWLSQSQSSAPTDDSSSEASGLSQERKRVNFEMGGTITTRSSSNGNRGSNWDSFERGWNQQTLGPFPTLQAPRQHWISAVGTAPDVMLALIRQLSSPAEILGRLTETICVAWTDQWRQAHYEYVRRGLRRTTTDNQVQSLLDTIEADLSKSSPKERYNAVSKHWSKWRSIKYANSTNVRLCDPSKATASSKHLLCALIYAEFIQTLLDSSAMNDRDTSSAIINHVRLMHRSPDYKKRVNKAFRDDNWPLIEDYFTSLKAPPSQLAESDDDQF